MVTCQSANQLKTPAKVSWAFKMVSVWFTRLHNHGEDCWSDSCPEDNHWHPSQGGWATSVYEVLYPSMLTESWVEEKDAQPTERTAALWGLSSKIDSRIWLNFTRNELRLGSRHQEPPHTDVSIHPKMYVFCGNLRHRVNSIFINGLRLHVHVFGETTWP